MGDADCGDDRPDTARAFFEGEVDQGDCARSEDIAQHGSQGASVGRDIIFLRTGDPAAPQAEIDRMLTQNAGSAARVRARGSAVSKAFFSAEEGGKGELKAGRR